MSLKRTYGMALAGVDLRKLQDLHGEQGIDRNRGG